MSFIDTLLARKGLTRADVPTNSKVGKIFRQQGVRFTPELERVMALPRRQWGDESLAELLTNEFKREGGTMKLRPVQAAALAEIHDCGGLLGALRCGAGKSLVCYLAPKAVGAKRPMLIIPAKLREKTERERMELQQHWVLPTMRIESYEMLSRADHDHLIENYKPDLIVSDECHKLKHPRTAAARRLKRYLQKNPDVRFVALSGTITGRSLHEYWHLARWALGDIGVPLPTDWAELSEWADCLDAVGSGTRTAPGALAGLCTPEEAKVIEYGGDVSIQAVRNAYQRRLVETPGVISTGGDQVACSLSINEIDVNIDHLEPIFAQMRATFETPDGHPFDDKPSLWRHCRELVCGYYGVWDPRPPPEWLEARKEWSAFVRETLSHSRTMDTGEQVLRAIKAGELPEGFEPLAKWDAIRDTFKQNSVANWVDDTTLNYCANWLANNEGICWVEHIPFGVRLSEMTGLPYYAGQARNAAGGHIIDARGPIIASIKACCEGENLQRYSKNLFPSVPPNGLQMEQVLSRTHRDGQLADTVEVDMILACREQYDGFLKAVRDARYAFDSTAASQKLLIADINISMGGDGGGLWR